jgi:HSP20 family molecular chaperone IbpA
MRNTKLQSILGLSLTLVVGFMSGFATRSLLPENSVKTEQLPAITFDSHCPAWVQSWPASGYFSQFSYPASTFAGFNSLFDEMINETLHPIALPHSLFAHSPLTLASSPDIDLKQTDNQIQVVLSTPGLKPEDVNVSLQGNKLVIEGHHKEQSANGMREETFMRTMDVPYDIDLSRVRKQSDHGVLKVTVPRSVLSSADLPI